MRVLLLFVWGFLLGGSVFGQAQVPLSPVKANLHALFSSKVKPVSAQTPGFQAGPGAMVFLFLSTECPLCRNYTRTLNELYTQYGTTARFYGIIPGKTEGEEAINGFVHTYHILFPLYVDGGRAVVQRLHAQVTPQAIVLDGSGRIVYSGLIDDWVVGLGVQRAHISHHYLGDALEAMAAGRVPTTGRTTAVGCLINAF